ncbi:interferon-induced protein 44 [Phodopus roborovskii]|uniref:Ifi44 protein n=1 Tax=Phodopus roborovskii TaxID=109678 RepID=A0AAU9YPA0_PHORO|nr:interferon-induced protein 44 [Phodopus roborovskii]XP_051051339.1 interferon-induced protein 44 [Phodopus roborovskii]XP_051051352.1 interferon-induced protein 44 [Phodopus roborovskii]CAH6777190.1 Ifi44 [Phodopus roborovskii]
MAMRTCLTWLQEKCLQNYFGGKQFCLLYKASVQKFSKQDLFWKCWDNGPTMVMLYSRNCVVGAYLKEGFQKKKIFITLFALQETEVSECTIGPYLPASLFYDRENFDCIPSFYIMLDEKNVIISSEICKKLGLPPRCSPMSIDDCETFRCTELLDERKTKGITLIQNHLLHILRTYKPYGDLVPQARILLLGPTGAGKSSFVNSVKSVFRGSITHQAMVGCGINGTSDKYRTYSIYGNDGSPLPFVLCDSLGLSQEAGLHFDDIHFILKGHTPDRYQFNSRESITSNHPNYIHDSQLKDIIHCVVFVFDATSVEQLSYGLVAKIKRIRRALIRCGILHVVLLTHVDRLDLITKRDLIDIYNCHPVKHKLEAVHRDFGFAFSDILVVSNYVSEWHLDPVKDRLILLALRQILCTANNFLEDLPLNKEVDL